MNSFLSGHISVLQKYSWWFRSHCFRRVLLYVYLEINIRKLVRPVVDIVSDVGGYRWGYTQAAIAWLPALHGVDDGVSRLPDNHRHHQQHHAGTKEGQQAWSQRVHALKSQTSVSTLWRWEVQDIVHQTRSSALKNFETKYTKITI